MDYVSGFFDFSNRSGKRKLKNRKQLQVSETHLSLFLVGFLTKKILIIALGTALYGFQ